LLGQAAPVVSEGEPSAALPSSNNAGRSVAPAAWSRWFPARTVAGRVPPDVPEE